MGHRAESKHRQPGTAVRHSGSSSSAVYTDGQVGGGSTGTTPLDLFAGRSIEVTVSYDGSLLHTHMLDPVSGSVFDSWSPIDIAAFVGGETAYVGFTASTNGNAATDQYFSNFRFTTVPAPATLPLLGALALGARRRR